MDTTVLYTLTYGLYVVGAYKDGRPVGCVINTCFQVTSENPRVAVSLNKQNYTLEAVREMKKFSLSIIAEDTDPAVISRFGFTSSRTTDKYEPFGYELHDYVPCVSGHFCGRLILEAEQFVDCGTHMVVIARLIDTVPGEGKPMTYAYYHNVIKGKAPKNAPTYLAEEQEDKRYTTGKHRFVCDICGYVAETDAGTLPSGYHCPVCNADVTHFHPA